MNLPKFLTSSPVSPVSMASSCHSSVLQWTAAAPPVAPPAPRSGTATAAAPHRSRTPCRGSPLRRNPGGRSPGRRAARCARGGCGGAGCARLHLSFEDLVCCVCGWRCLLSQADPDWQSHRNTTIRRDVKIIFQIHSRLHAWNVLKCCFSLAIDIFSSIGCLCFFRLIYPCTGDSLRSQWLMASKSSSWRPPE